MSNVWEELFLKGKIRGTTRSLIDSFVFDTWPTTPVVVDFRITSQDHFAALKYSILFDDNTIKGSPNEDNFETRLVDEMQRRIVELDRAMWSSQKLNAFVQKYAPGRLSEVVFDTGMDELLEWE